MKVDLDQHRLAKNILTLTTQYSIPFSFYQAQLCSRHIAIMLQWNRVVNLTRITSLSDILAKNIMDSLIAGKYLSLFQGWLLDVGSGAGFPGITLKILYPELKVVLLEKHRRKANFLRVVIAYLGVRNVWVIRGRWQDLSHCIPSHLPRYYDLITQRALQVDTVLLNYLLKNHLSSKGRFAFWAGPKPVAPETAVELTSSGIVRERDFIYKLPWNAGKRRLLIWRLAGDEPTLRQAALHSG